jgi:hypothetical protein
MDLVLLPPPPSPTTMADTSSTMEEMSLQLCGVQQDLQDVLDAVRHPGGKRKRAASINHNDAEPTSPTAHRSTPRRPRDASPVHSLMYLCHATTTTQEDLDMLANKSSLCLPTTMPTATAHPTLKTSAKPDTPLPNTPATALVATEEWRIAMGKAT